MMKNDRIGKNNMVYTQQVLAYSIFEELISGIYTQFS
jgi:hypothetical protein